MSGQEQHGRDAHQSKRHPAGLRRLPGASTDNMTVPATRATNARPKQTTSNSSESRIGRPDARLREMRAPTAPRATSATATRWTSTTASPSRPVTSTSSRTQIQGQDDRVPADDDEALEGTYEPSSRIRKEHVKEENGGQEEQTLSERPKRRGVGLGQP